MELPDDPMMLFRNNPDTLQVNRLTVYYCKSETCSDNNSYTPTKWFIRFPAGASPAESVITQNGDVLESVWEDVSIRPRACFSPSYNKVKSQTKHVWLLTLL